MTTRTRQTVDGVTVRAGDQIWIDRPGFGVRSRRLDRNDIDAWWDTFYAGKAYANEIGCVENAITTRKRDVARARVEIRTAKAYAAKLRSRLALLRKITPIAGGRQAGGAIAEHNRRAAIVRGKTRSV